MKDDKGLRIEKIATGTVIDHIESGKAFIVLDILGLDGKDGRLITVGINVNSKKLNGKKDIIKVENVFLDNEQLNQISLISPKCTIAYIEEFKVSKKFILDLPERFLGIFDPVLFSYYFGFLDHGFLGLIRSINRVICNRERRWYVSSGGCGRSNYEC